MRITGGKYKGLNLNLRVGKGVRPTASRVREAIFSMIGQDLTDKVFLDAFGGSGLMGIEAYSRGAQTTIYEKSNTAYRNILKCVKKEGMNITVRRGSADHALTNQWDIIFMDPPYAVPAQPWLTKAQYKFRHVLVYEHSSQMILPDRFGDVFRAKFKKYGDCAISIFHCDT